MTTKVLRYCFLGESKVSLSIDPDSEESCVSAPAAYSLNLPCIFDKLGRQFSSVEVEVPTVSGFYTSQMNLVVSYGLPSDVLLGSDWVLPCQPIFIDDRPFISNPALETVRVLPPPHSWRPINGPFLTLRASHPL